MKLSRLSTAVAASHLGTEHGSVVRLPGRQKVGGSNPLVSTKGTVDLPQP